MSEDFIQVITFDHYHFEIWDNAPKAAKRLRLFRGIGHEDEVPLQAGDLKVLEQLLCPKTQRWVKHEDIVRILWGADPRGIDNVYTHIHALRTALGDGKTPRRLIGSASGKGYIFLLEVKRTKRTANRAVLPPIYEANEEQTQAAFDEFFGVSTPDHDGVIMLPSHLIDRELPGLGQVRPYAQSESRFYKARTIVNKYDAYGATLLQEAFQKQQRKAPKLIFRDRNDKETDHSAQFKISMGLGFTVQTSKTILDRTCASWMSISHKGGDALSLREFLLLGMDPKKTRLRWEPDREEPGFSRVVPSDWDSKRYVEAWSRMLPPDNGPDVRDYALIFRNTRLDGGRQILWVVAGFTERSTALGGMFLAEKWPALWQEHVRGRAFSGSHGDFLILIEGPSDPEKLREWSEVKEFEWTPTKLKAIREKLKAKDKTFEWSCEWADRDLEKPND